MNKVGRHQGGLALALTLAPACELDANPLVDVLAQVEHGALFLCGLREHRCTASKSRTPHNNM